MSTISPERAGVGRSEELLEADLLERYVDLFETDFVTGVPCGELREFIRQSDERQDVYHAPVTNERESIGMAVGAWLAGKHPAIYMQNSGLFVASNDIASLMVPCEVEAIFAISWRGSIGETATQHMLTGRSSRLLLESLEVSTISDPSDESLRTLRSSQTMAHRPAAVLVRRQKFNTNPEAKDRADYPRPVSKLEKQLDGRLSLSRDEAIAEIVETLGVDTPTISSTGLISRSIYHHYDGDNQFYNAGGFGVTSAIGLGIALARPDVPVAVIEGDGSVLTNPGALNVIGHYQPKNLIHVVLNNSSYASCSLESTIGSELIPAYAQASGYRAIYDIDSKDALASALAMAQRDQGNGPQLVHVRINTEGPRSFRRPLEMADIAKRFRAYMARSK